MSETIAAVEAAKAIVSMRLLLYELGYEQPGSSRLYVDNEATVLNANGTNQSKRSKHFQIRTELLHVYTDLDIVHYSWLRQEEAKRNMRFWDLS